MDKVITENRGGARAGAGRKPVFELSDRERQRIISDVKAEAKRNGTSFGTELAKLMFGTGNDKRLKLSAMQLYIRDVLPKVSESESTRTMIQKPQIFLPEKYPDSDEAPDYTPSR